LVNVHIHQFQPGGAVVDAAALAQFQEQWATYGKLVESDCLSQREVGGMLRATLNETFKSPFSFLDIACGDASMMTAALRGTKVRHYHGIDLSQPALELAAENLAGMPFEVDLDHRDFVEAMLRRPEHADAAWCSLSIHHLATEDKLALMKAIRGAVGARGLFIVWTIKVTENQRARENSRKTSSPHHTLRLSIRTGPGILPSVTISSNLLAEMPIYMAAPTLTQRRVCSERTTN
jgi:SAM-dependent methyltransferase